MINAQLRGLFRTWKDYEKRERKISFTHQSIETELGIQFDQAAAEKLNLSFILSYGGEEKGKNSNFYQISGRQ